MTLEISKSIVSLINKSLLPNLPLTYHIRLGLPYNKIAKVEEKK